MVGVEYELFLMVMVKFVKKVFKKVIGEVVFILFEFYICFFKVVNLVN